MRLVLVVEALAGSMASSEGTSATAQSQSSI